MENEGTSPEAKQWPPRHPERGDLVSVDQVIITVRHWEKGIADLDFQYASRALKSESGVIYPEPGKEQPMPQSAAIACVAELLKSAAVTSLRKLEEGEAEPPAIMRVSDAEAKRFMDGLK